MLILHLRISSPAALLFEKIEFLYGGSRDAVLLRDVLMLNLISISGTASERSNAKS